MNHAQLLFDNNVRFDMLMWLPATVGDESAYPQCFEDFCDSIPDTASHPLFAELPELAKFAEQEDEIDKAEAAYLLSRRTGFLAQFATPVMSWPRSDMFSYSWGHYWTHWVYADDLDSLTEKAIAWADERREAEKATAA